jgi:hypothetical protein
VKQAAAVSNLAEPPPLAGNKGITECGKESLGSLNSSKFDRSVSHKTFRGNPPRSLVARAVDRNPGYRAYELSSPQRDIGFVAFECWNFGIAGHTTRAGWHTSHGRTVDRTVEVHSPNGRLR